MKILLSIVLLLFFLNAHSKDSTDVRIKHFEVNTSALVWTPLSNKLKAYNYLIVIESPNGVKSSAPMIFGYGGTISPKIEFAYTYNPYWGVSLGLNILMLKNELSYTSDSSPIHTMYAEITGRLLNLQLGYYGKSYFPGRVNLFYGAGMNFLINYHFEMDSNIEFVASDVVYTGSVVGVYSQVGLNVKITNNLFLKTGMEYSYIPSNKYENNFPKGTNFGGIAGQIGLSYNFNFKR